MRKKTRKAKPRATASSGSPPTRSSPSISPRPGVEGLDPGPSRPGARALPRQAVVQSQRLARPSAPSPASSSATSTPTRSSPSPAPSTYRSAGSSCHPRPGRPPADPSSSRPRRRAPRDRARRTRRPRVRRRDQPSPARDAPRRVAPTAPATTHRGPAAHHQPRAAPDRIPGAGHDRRPRRMADHARAMANQLEDLETRARASVDEELAPGTAPGPSGRNHGGAAAPTPPSNGAVFRSLADPVSSESPSRE